MQISQIMTTEVEGIAPVASAADARNLMKSRGIRHLVVRQGGRVVGVISQRDLGGTRGSVPAGTVGELMTTDVVTVAPDATLRDAANLLRGHRIGCLPVLDGPSLAGIVTISDVLDVIGRGEVHLHERGRPYLAKRQGPAKKVRSARVTSR